MMLKDKVAVIYGATGAIGSTAAHAFAREGARVFLTGRSTSKLNKVAQEISSASLSAEVAEVDALDEQGVNDHLEKTFEKTGHIDISFNAFGIPIQGIEGIPLIELPTERFFLPVSTYTKSHFITAKAAREIHDPKEIWSYPFHYAKPGPSRYASCGRNGASMGRNGSFVKKSFNGTRVIGYTHSMCSNHWFA